MGRLRANMELTHRSLLLGERQRLAPTLLTFVVPAGAGTVALTASERLLLDRTSWAVVPAGAKVTLSALSQQARVTLLGASEALLKHVVETYRFLGVERAVLDRYLGTVRLLPRTLWVYELCHRYVFEREVFNETDNDATRFLETEIVKEAHFLCRDHERGTTRTRLEPVPSALADRAMAFIENHLFERERIEALARHVGASESTLLRVFKKELGCTPSGWWRGRRLDEALAMLRSGPSSVAEVAIRVGYESPAAFTEAFQLRFGLSPSACRAAAQR